MRVIFLDVDGVLNTTYTKNRIPGLNYIGVDPRRVEKLRSLVDQSNQLDETVIVLSSSWRAGVDRQAVKISRFWVRTSYWSGNGGLQDGNVREALKKMKLEIPEEFWTGEGNGWQEVGGFL